MSAEEIKRLRQALGMTQVQLAALLEVHKATIKRWEGGKIRAPRHVVKYLESLAKGEVNNSGPIDKF